MKFNWYYLYLHTSNTYFLSTITLLYIILAVLFSVAISFFQYFFKVKKAPKHHIILFILRSLALFLLFLLFINPKVKIQETENKKPKLAVLVDNSMSTSFFKEEKSIENIINTFKASNKLKEKFDVNLFSFNKNIESLDSLTFTKSKTNIAKAITSINNLYKDDLGGIVLVSDGNQTIGDDYEFLHSKKAVYPIVIGDTTIYEDLKISQLNVNKYSYLNNKFPVEVFLNYEGKKEINPTFSIYKSGKKIFTKKVSLSPTNSSAIVTTNLTSNKEGIHYYSTSIEKLENEKNIKNNSKSFSVEVINEQTKVLLLSSILHPDLGALKKAIESNKQRKVEIAQINSFKGSIKEYQFVICYQPNVYFKKFFEERSSNFLIITGAKTDWNFINSLNLGIHKSSINQSENYSANYNVNYLTYIQKDIGFNGFPPLTDKFGAVNMKGHQSLLFQKIKGISTKAPLLSTFEKGESKYALLLGEGIWKWRSSSYLKENSFEVFDEFVNNLVQFLASNKKRKRLDVKLSNLYLANETIRVSALYLDKNYKFDERASLQFVLTNKKTKETKIYPFSLMNNSYQIAIEGLSSGDYTYTVKVENQNLAKSGKFKVADFQIEEQFTNSNSKKLASIAKKTKGKHYFKTQEQQLINELIKNKNYFTVQKSTIKEENLIHWKWILFLVVTLLAVEWFLRKYFGKI